jgi:hypothetical protein
MREAAYVCRRVGVAMQVAEAGGIVREAHCRRGRRQRHFK